MDRLRGLTSYGLVTVLSTHRSRRSRSCTVSAGGWEWLSSKEWSVASSAAWMRTKICMSRRSWTNRIAFLRTHSFTTTRQGYGQMLAWMRSLGDLQRIGVESTGSYGAGLLPFMQQARVAVL